MARSTHVAGSSTRLVGYLLLIGGLGMAALSVKVGWDNYRRYQHDQSVGQLRGAASIWDWLQPPAIVGGVGLGMLIVGWIMAARSHAAARLLRGGDAGRARVVELVQTGTLVDEQVTVRLTLLVDLPGHAPYAATTKTTLPMAALGQIQPGAIVAVRAHQRDPQRVVIDWAGARQAGG
jgi:hypothetical protein